MTNLLTLIITLMMEAVSSSETSVNIYQTTRRCISDIHTRRRENLKSHLSATGSISVIRMHSSKS
jgi:hypothetical protein